MIEPMSVEYMKHMGDDNWIADVARVSFGKESKDFSKERNDRLIRFLAKHNHWSPFSHCIVSFRMTAPIFVARQLAKHQVGLSWNEISRRYVDYEPTYYCPSTWRNRPAENIKQGSGKDSRYQEVTQDMFNELVDLSDMIYNRMINLDIAPEQARMVLPQNMMTKWIWTGSLYAWSRIWKLRVHPTAQIETRMLIEQIGPHMETLFPIAWKELLNDNEPNQRD